MKKWCLLLLVAATIVGCGHEQTTKVGLMSFGNLEGKALPDDVSGELLFGKSCGHGYRLSDAVRDALKDTEYDTLVDAEILNETGLFIWSNCIIVSGNALNSRLMASTGGAR